MHSTLVVNEHFETDGAIVFRKACRLGCEGIVSKRLRSPYRSGPTAHWIKVKNPKAPAVTREAERSGGNVAMQQTVTARVVPWEKDKDLWGVAVEINRDGKV